MKKSHMCESASQLDSPPQSLEVVQIYTALLVPSSKPPPYLSLSYGFTYCVDLSYVCRPRFFIIVWGKFIRLVVGATVAEDAESSVERKDADEPS